jgi:predicted MPP superfamily phosphohydrolase
MFSKNENSAHETVNFECAIATANRLKPAFVVITGDLINQGTNAAQAAEYRRIAPKIDTRIPIYAMPEITMWRTNRRRLVSPHTASESGAITIRSMREAGAISIALSRVVVQTARRNGLYFRHCS